MMEADLKTKTVKNIGFNAFANVAKFLLSAVASIILAQKLSPSGYGVVGFAMILKINLLSRFSDLAKSHLQILLYGEHRV
jgi:O-antigen/teichoic acid export membrane protein